MFKILVVASLLSGFSAVAQGASGVLIKSFTVANNQATILAKIDNVDTSLVGSVDQMTSQDGRIIADCAKIGEVGLQCEIRRDGGNGVIALFKPTANGYALANKNLILTNGGDSLVQLAEIQNASNQSAEQVFASLNAAIAKSSTLEQVADALRAQPKAERVQVSTGVPQIGQPAPQAAGPGPAAPMAPPVVGRPPVVAVPNGCCGHPGRSAVRGHHEEEDVYIEKRRKVISTYMDEQMVPVIEGYVAQQNCYNNNCGGQVIPYGPPCVGNPCPPRVAHPCVAPCGGPVVEPLLPPPVAGCGAYVPCHPVAGPCGYNPCDNRVYVQPLPAYPPADGPGYVGRPVVTPHIRRW